MIEPEDASKVADTLGRNLVGLARDKTNFQGLPDTFWGYFARGHDGKGSFGVFVTYSEKKSDVDDLIAFYETWVKENKARTD